MEQTSNSSRFLSWGIFIVVVGLIVWGLVAAQQKAAREEANLVLPDQIVATDHTRGSAVATLTLVEYGDFQCPACGYYYPAVEEVIKALGPEKIRYVFRHFPLSGHANAVPAAKAAEAAGIQGKFWEMYNILYTKQAAWTPARDPKTVFAGYAKEIGLDEAKFIADFDLKDLTDRIDLDYRGGTKAGVNSTPTFFLNGKQISPKGTDDFKSIINNALTTSSTTTQ